MKKFLFLKSSPGLPIQGAEISVFERCALLRKYGWESELVSTGELRSAQGFINILTKLHIPYAFDEKEQQLRFTFHGVKGHILLAEDGDAFSSKSTDIIKNLFQRAIDAHNPQALMGNARDPVALATLAVTTGLPRIIFLTEDEYIRKDHPDSSVFVRDLSAVEHVVVASEYLAVSLKREYGIPSTVLANAVDLERYKLKKDALGDYITLLHPYPHKGVEFFLELAREMPERTFLVAAGVGPNYKKIKPVLLSIPNIKLAAFTSSPQDLYRASRVVLVPSIWQEAFSRVILEAMCTGTPVITSGTGGMKQTGGAAAIHIPVYSKTGEFNVKEWRSAIEALDDENHYRLIQDKMLARINEYEADLAQALSLLSQMLSGDA